MVRHNKKKTTRCGINEENVKKALKDITNKRYSCRQAASLYGLNRTTLIYRLKKLKEKGIDLSDSGNEGD